MWCIKYYCYILVPNECLNLVDELPSVFLTSFSWSSPANLLHQRLCSFIVSLFMYVHALFLTRFIKIDICAWWKSFLVCYTVGAYSNWLDASSSGQSILPSVIDILMSGMSTSEDSAAAAALAFRHICAGIIFLVKFFILALYFCTTGKLTCLLSSLIWTSYHSKISLFTGGMSRKFTI